MLRLRALVVGAVLALSACHEEPTIVIKFEPNDLATPATPAPSPTPSPAPVVVKKTKHAAECHAAADCVVEPEECCDCANGGRLHAIPKARAASKAERAKKCKSVACTMMLSTDPTCGKRPDCVAGECVMVDKPAAKTPHN